MTAPYELRLAVRYLRVHRGRTFLSVITMISVAGVAVGAAALVIALSLMTGFEADMKQRILRGSADLQVLDRGAATFEDAETVRATAAAVPGVVAAAPVLFSPAMIMNDSGGSPSYAEVEGVDPSLQDRVVDFGPEAPADPLKALGATGATGRPGVVLGADLAARLAVKPGDAVRVLVPRVIQTPFAPIPRSLVLQVAGTIRTDAYPQDSQRAYVALDVIRRLLDAHGRASWIEVRLADRRRLASQKVAVGRAMGDRFVVLDLLEQNKEILKAFNTEKLFLFLAIALIVVVASLNIVSTLVLMVNDKVREIGTLTAMGAKPRSIAAVFMLQGLVIGVVGTTVGLTIGTATAWWLDAYQIMKLNPDVYFVSHVPFETRPQDVVLVGAAALVIAFCATLYPAWKAARLRPVEAIRHE
ncbi:MAG TPA: ABC transporter permease [Candidatus Polarisedimenticolaceae bacterium]|nr:ABC transporter permease [Candidatus Polarisedimenticolaceae bacterium]